MKKLLVLLSFATLVCVSINTQAQTVKYVNRNADERFGYSITTNDSATHYVDSVTIENNEGGMITVSVIGYAKDTAYCVTGVKSVRFNKRRGTLTMGTINNDLAVVSDAALSPATWTLIAANNRIYVQVKGALNQSIVWTSIIKRKTVKLPF